jgi:predicted phage terminase large subunit-like protein
MYLQKEDWSIVYDKAIRDDGSLFFPSRLTPEFLNEQRRVMGSYIFYNQYLNEIIPAGEQDFKPDWLKYYDTLPKIYNTFAFVDPAISLSEKADYTALTVVHVSEDNDWYVSVAKRSRLTATQLIDLLFKVHEMFKPQVIGVEVVAYQMAIMHFLDQEMRRRNKVISVHGLKRGPDKTKEMRIRGLIPRFEWGRIFLKTGMTDFEDEYSKFPKSPHDDILDSLSSIEDIAYPPAKLKEIKRDPHPSSPAYESQFIQRLIREKAR